VQRRVAAGVLTAGHARALLAFTTAEQQEQIATRIVAEGLSVRAVEELAAMVGPEKAPRRRTPRSQPPGLDDVATRLAERLETRVKVEMGRSKGRITVEFASFDDLERIVTAMAPAPPSWA
jgi:ParB family chromosome partitioning protein